MTYSGSIYFLGQYRPAYFEASTVAALTFKMRAAIRPMTDARMGCWLLARVREGAQAIARPACSGWSADHNDRGVSFATRSHDPWLDAITAELPPCPGLDYSQAINGGQRNGV